MDSTDLCGMALCSSHNRALETPVFRAPDGANITGVRLSQPDNTKTATSLLNDAFGSFDVADYVYHETSLLKITNTDTYKNLQQVTISKGTTLEADGDRACHVCLDNIEDEEVMLMHNGKCQWLAYADCGLEWFKKHNTCPFCRARLGPPAGLPAIIAGGGERLDQIIRLWGDLLAESGAQHAQRTNGSQPHLPSSTESTSVSPPAPPSVVPQQQHPYEPAADAPVPPQRSSNMITWVMTAPTSSSPIPEIPAELRAEFEAQDRDAYMSHIRPYIDNIRRLFTAERSTAESHDRGDSQLGTLARTESATVDTARVETARVER